MREMGYVDTARLSGMSGAEIIVRELAPNLLPYLVAVFVLAVSASILLLPSASRPWASGRKTNRPSE